MARGIVTCMADGQDCLSFILRSYEILDGVFG